MSFRLIKNIVAQKLGFSAPPSTPRGPCGLALGRPVDLDETPFILAEGFLDLRFPGPHLTVVAHGSMTISGVTAHRYYLSDRKGVIQVVEGDECRFFRPFDEVYPASSEEWAFWLDDADGYIGYPTFVAKDNRAYQRVWNPGAQRTTPLCFEEWVEWPGGAPTLERHTAMLYARDTQNPNGSPWEYLLLSAIEAHDGSAWVDLMLGMDITPSMIVGR
ncbi:hypothetical protein CCP2SC5_10067 [Azospirillaceae bacterium]